MCIYIYLHIKAYTLLILTSSPEKKRNDRWHDRGNHHYIEPLPGRGPSHSRAGSSIGIGRQLKHHWATALDTHLPVAGPPDKLQTFVQVAILGSNMCNPSTNHNRATRGHESGHEGKTITAFICVSVCVCIVHGCMRSCQNKYANRLGANGKPPPAPASRETTTTPPPPPPAGEAAAARTLRKLPPQHIPSIMHSIMTVPSIVHSACTQRYTQPAWWTTKACPLEAQARLALRRIPGIRGIRSKRV